MEKRIGFGEWLTIGTFVVGIVVWAVRLEGRLNSQEQQLDDVRLQQSQNIQQFREDLAYIRSRIDQATAPQNRTPTYTGSSSR
jgi:hypothetical protein